MTEIIYFIKFLSEEEYADDFINGNLRFGTLGSFKGGDPKDGRGDRGEGLIFLLQSNDIKSVSIGRDTINADYINNIEIHSQQLDDVNLLSLFSVIEKNGNIRKIDSRCRKFGQWAVLLNPNQFIERLTEVCRTKSKNLLHQLMHYSDDATRSRQTDLISSLFVKDKSYSYQNEYRFALTHPTDSEDRGKVYHLNIGDISDFSAKCRTDNIIRTFSNNDNHD